MKKNDPKNWLKSFVFHEGDKNKYDFGHAVICGGGFEKSGAAKLAAMAALRIGAGLVTVVLNRKEHLDYFPGFYAIMTKWVDDDKSFNEFINHEKVKSILIGPGYGVLESTYKRTLMALKTKKHCVLDADSISCFAGREEDLFKLCHSNVVLTPHEGEFKRIFPDLHGRREERALLAAKKTGAIIVLKGEKTLIANKDGELIENLEASADLATAGSGDVLAGIITGLLALGMDGFAASQAAVWIHGRVGKDFGHGLVADDIVDGIPAVLNGLVSSGEIQFF